MPPAANQALVPPADLPYFIGANVQRLKNRLSALAIPFNEYDRKYVLYYRLVTTGNTLPNMPVGYVPTRPPMPPALPAVVGPPNPHRKLCIISSSKAISLVIVVPAKISQPCPCLQPLHPPLLLHSRPKESQLRGRLEANKLMEKVLLENEAMKRWTSTMMTVESLFALKQRQPTNAPTTAPTVLRLK